jgi:hypothetical protein
LVAKLHAGPAQPAQKAWNFAEHLLKTHDFFLPLRSTARAHATAQHDDWPSRESLSPSDASPSDVASDELKTISTIFGGIDPSPNSLFQRLFASLAILNMMAGGADASETHSLLDQLSSDIRSCNPTELSQKVQFGAFEELMKTLHVHHVEFRIVRKVLLFAFQIADSCPGQRHILMHMSHVEKRTGESLLQFLVKFICSQSVPPGAGQSGSHDIQLILASATRLIKSIVSSSIPYASLSDFPHTGCYGNPKMESMLSLKVLHSILVAVQADAASESFMFLNDASSHLDHVAVIAILDQLRISHWHDLLSCSDSQLHAIAALLKREVAQHILLVMTHVRQSRAWRSEALGDKVLQAFFQDSAETECIFAGRRRIFLDMIREDETIQEFQRLCNAQLV